MSKPVGSMVISLDLDPSAYTASEKKILAGSKEAIGSIDANWKKLGGKCDAYYDAMRQSFFNSHQLIINKAGTTTDTIVRSYQLMTAKIEELNQQQYAHKYKTLEAEKMAAQQTAQARLATIERENNATAQYWLARMKFEKDALAQSVLEQKKAAEAVIALREKENLANQQYWLAKMAYDKKAAAESVAAQTSAQASVRSMGLMQIAAIKEDADRTKAIQDKAKEAQLANYTTLGIRSTATINEQIANVQRAATTQQGLVQKGSQDWINIERAKNDKLKELNKEMVGGHEMSMASMTRAVLRLYAAYYVTQMAVQAIITPLVQGINYLSQIETATLGIASSYMTGGQYIDATTGKALEGSVALKAAQVDSRAMIKELEYANLQTIATLDQLIIAYQQTLPVAIAKGFNRDQVKDFTLAMVQAAGAIGLPMDQMGEETRSLLTGSINPRNSRIATVLGLRNEDIRLYEGNATALFDFLMEKLSAYRIAGIEAQKTWAGLWSNTKDIINQALGTISQPIFDKLKDDISAITGSVYTLNDETKKIEWRPEFIASVEKVKEAVAGAYDWMKKFAGAVYSVGSIVIPYTGTIIEMIVTGSLVKGLAAAVIGVGSFSAALAGAKTVMEGLAVASKSFLPILVGFAAFKGTQWVDGLINGVDAADLKLSGFTKNQQKIIAEEEARKIEYRQREQGLSEKAIKDAQQAADEISRITVRQFREMVKVQADFEKEYAKMTMTREESDIQALNVKVEAWKRAGVDIIKIEELTQAELREIKLRANNEQLQLIEELWKATGNTKYKDTAILLMEEIKDAEELKWRAILKNDDDAFVLRTKREQEYHDKINKMIDKTVDVEEKAADERGRIIKRFYEEVEEAKNSDMALGAGPASAGGISSMPYIPGGIYQPFYDLVSGKTAADNAKRLEAQKKYAEEQAEIAADRAEKVAEETKKIADEYQREYEARVDMFNSLKESLDSYVQEKARKPWGQAEYQAEFLRLSDSFNASPYFDEQIEILKEMLDVQKELDSIAQQQLEQQKATAASLKESSQSVSDWLINLSQGELAPVQSASGYASRFEEMRVAAKSDPTKTADFLSYAQKYLEFEKNYGTVGSYADVYKSVTEGVQSLGTWQELLANMGNLGLGQTASDLDKVAKAFLDLGVSLPDLKLAAEGVANTIGTSAGEAGTLNSSMDILKGAASTASGANGLGLLLTALGITLPEAAGNATGNTSDLIGTLQGTENPFANVATAINGMMTGLDTGFSSLDTFFGKLAENLGLTYTSASAETATGYLASKYSAALIPVQYTFANSGDDAWWVANYGGQRLDTVTIPKNLGVNYASEYGMIYANRYKPEGPYMYNIGGLYEGGLTSGLTYAGEGGPTKPEYVVPTYEPQKSKFLKNMGADPETLGAAIARHIQSSNGGSSESTIHNHIYIDGKEIKYVVTRGLKTDGDMIESVASIARRVN